MLSSVYGRVVRPHLYSIAILYFTASFHRIIFFAVNAVHAESFFRQKNASERMKLLTKERLLIQ